MAVTDHRLDSRRRRAPELLAGPSVSLGYVWSALYVPVNGDALMRASFERSDVKCVQPGASEGAV